MERFYDESVEDKNARVSDTKNVIIVFYGGKTKAEDMQKLGKYLTENKFNLYLTGPLGFGSCPWRFINLDNKVMVLGKPGVKFAESYIKHAVLINEFIEINESYKKCKTLDNDIVNRIIRKYNNNFYFGEY